MCTCVYLNVSKTFKCRICYKFFCYFIPIFIPPGVAGPSYGPYLGRGSKRFEKPRSSFHVVCILYCGCFNLFCNVWVSVCGDVLTIVYVFWYYVYLYILCFVLFVLCFVFL